MKSAALFLLCASFLFVRAEARTGATASSDQKDATKIEDRAQAAAKVLSELSGQVTAPPQAAMLVQEINKDFSASQASR